MRRVRLRVRGFCQYLSSARARTSDILAGKRDSRRHFERECRNGGNKLSNVPSFIILLSREGLTSFSIYNRNIFLCLKISKIKLSGVSIFRASPKTLC